MGWGKGELLASLTFSLWGVSTDSYLGSPFSSLPAQGRSFRPSRANGKPPQQHPCHQEAHQHRVSICGPGGRWETPHGAWGAAAACPSASAQPAAL